MKLYRSILLAVFLSSAGYLVQGCGSNPCPPFKKAVCGGCGEKSAACQNLLDTLERAREENRDLDTLCEKGHEVFKDLPGNQRCDIVLPLVDDQG